MEKTYQDQVDDWVKACFGSEIATNKTERNYRFLEEALELVQAKGITKEDVLKLVDYTFSRPAGEPFQEVGGVMITLAALCNANNYSMNAAGEVELIRAWEKIATIREKQANKKIKDGPLP